MFHVSCLCLASLSSNTQLPVEPVGVLMSSSEPDEPDVLSRAAYARLLADREVQGARARNCVPNVSCSMFVSCELTIKSQVLSLQVSVIITDYSW